jgi:hypothetical protein
VPSTTGQVVAVRLRGAEPVPDVDLRQEFGKLGADCGRQDGTRRGDHSERRQVVRRGMATQGVDERTGDRVADDHEELDSFFRGQS